MFSWCTVLCDITSKLFPIINTNRFNQDPTVYVCTQCQSVDELTGSNISLVEQEDFLANPSKHIDNAYNKSEDEDGYKINPTR